MARCGDFIFDHRTVHYLQVAGSNPITLSAVIQKFDYVFFPEALKEPAGATDRSPETGRGMPRPYAKFVDWFKKIRYTIYEFMYLVEQHSFSNQRPGPVLFDFSLIAAFAISDKGHGMQTLPEE